MSEPNVPHKVQALLKGKKVEVLPTRQVDIEPRLLWYNLTKFLGEVSFKLVMYKLSSAFVKKLRYLF